MNLYLMLLLVPWGQGTPAPAYDHVAVTFERAEDPRPDYRISENGLIAVRDAQTGELRAPTAEERKTIDAAMSAGRKAEISIPEDVAGDGSVSVVIGTLFMNYSVVIRAKDGSQRLLCLDELRDLGSLTKEVADDLR